METYSFCFVLLIHLMAYQLLMGYTYTYLALAGLSGCNDTPLAPTYVASFF